MNDPQSVIGRQLYRLLPEVYRTRDSTDKDGGPRDLQNYLDSCGQLLDRVARTLEQRLADSFPDGHDGIGPAQTWILPYLAELFDARLVSPAPTGRARELGNAIRWRQRKGTLAAVEQIAQAVSGTEVELQEGWKRIIRTPRMGQPMLPPLAFGDTRQYKTANPADSARQPGLPVATIDFRRPSRAVTNSDQTHPLGRFSNFVGKPRFWVHVNPFGSPCFPDSYEDVSLRTIDLRTPDWRRGHIHPRRVLLFAPPPIGFFKPGWEKEPATTGDLTFSIDQPHVVEGQIFDGKLTVSSGRLTLRRCAVRELVIQSADADDGPSLIAEDCLFDKVTVSRTARLEYCTVLSSFETQRIQASDCIFVRDVTFTDPVQESRGCIRFSRISQNTSEVEKLSSFDNTTRKPVFFHLPVCDGDTLVLNEAAFGEPGCGVLHPATSDAICFGAEDRGEMGVYHRQHHCLRQAAVLEKLKDFLPLGIEAVWIPDPRLLQPPPDNKVIL